MTRLSNLRAGNGIVTVTAASPVLLPAGIFIAKGGIMIEGEDYAESMECEVEVCEVCGKEDCECEC